MKGFQLSLRQKTFLINSINEFFIQSFSTNILNVLGVLVRWYEVEILPNTFDHQLYNGWPKVFAPISTLCHLIAMAEAIKKLAANFPLKKPLNKVL